MIEAKDIEQVARLARSQIEDDQIPELTNRLDRILAMVDRMQSENTDGVEPMANPHDASQRLREDKVTESDQRDKLLANAPMAENGLFLVPKVID